MFYLSDGTRISCGVISQPCTISHFEIGYILHPTGKLDAIQRCDLKLYRQGENGDIPNEINFNVLGKGKLYSCYVKYFSRSIHFKGNDHEAKLCELFFTCDVNGVKGRGVSEWHYNNVGTYTVNKK